MRFLLATSLVLALVASGCRDVPTESAAGADAGAELFGKGSASPSPVPFHADLEWEILGWTMPPEDRCPPPTSAAGPFYMLGSLRGAGTATHMGRITADVSHCIAPDFSFVLGAGEVRTANGDVLRMSYDGLAGPNPELPEIFWVADETITGGTGRFSGATGSVFEYGEATITAFGPGGIPLAGSASSTMDGWIVYDARYDGPRYGRVSGGGKIREGIWQVSFAGHGDRDALGGVTSSWRATFDRVSVPEVSGGTFVATSASMLRFWRSTNPAECIGRAYLVMDGRFEGESEWSVSFLAADAHGIGDGAFDTIRIVLSGPDGSVVYDTSDEDPAAPGGDFPSVSNCCGTARAELDVGDVRVQMPE